MKYDIILFENFHSAFHHKYDVHLIARMLKSQGMKVAILNVYGEDNPEDYPDIDLLDLPFSSNIPDDKAWLECKGNIVKRLYYVIRFLIQQHRYMKKVRDFVQDKADSFYLGSYHLLMPSIFFGLKKSCYYWGLRSYRMTGFWRTFKSNPFLVLRMENLKRKFLRNNSQMLFVSNEIIKKEFIKLGVPEDRLVIREERCIEDRKNYNPASKDKEFSLLVIGGLRRQKHIETTIKAFKNASLNNAVLMLVGENQDKDYEKLISEEIVGSPNIQRINERLQYEEFYGYMARAHFTLFADEMQISSVTNGTMMESIINFTPFIAPDHEPYSYYVKEYGLGLVYKSGDVGSYTEAIKKAQVLGYDFFIENIIRFQKLIEFDNVADKLCEALKRKNCINKKSKMKTAIINTIPIPSGQASVNRLLSYSKGMVEMGDEINVLSSGYAEPSYGEVNGVRFHNFGNRGGTTELMSVLIKIIAKVWKDHYDAVILVSNSLLLLYPLVTICKLRGIKLIQEKSEFPFVLMKKGVIRKIWASFYTSTTYKLFDGLIVMTKPLLDYFSTKVRKSCKLIEIPMTVDLDRFAVKKTENKELGDYIAYCGNMAGNKDGVVNLIDAFDIASKQLNDVKLLLIGGSSVPEDLERLKAYSKDKGDGRIVFYGKASRDEIPQLLVNAKALALARPSSLQSTGGFPTKLGEYLATSNPVVVTAVGDIPRYLNEKNSFIVEPDNNSAFAEQIVRIFKDYNKAKDIGKQGRIVAENNFNYRVQSPRIHDFIQELI